MKQSILLALGLMVFSLNAQSLEWAKQMSGPSGEGGTAMALDASGNVYTIGSFRQTVDFDPSANTFNLTSNGEADIYISKLDSQGNFLWAKQIGAQFYDDDPGNIVLDTNGNILVAGSFRGTIDLNPGAAELNVTTQGKEAFLLKLDSNGEFLWAKHWGGNSNSDENRVYTLILDSSDNIILGGGFMGANDFDPSSGTFNATASFFEDAYISKFEPNGNFLWAKTFGGDAVGSRDYVKALAVDGSGNIVASGPFSGDIATYNLTNGHNFYIKLDANGNMVWAKQTLSSVNVVLTNSLQMDAAGNAYMLGRFRGTCDFDPGSGTFNLTGNNGSFDIFILKLDTSGNFVWAKGFGSESGLDEGYSIALDNQGYLYTTGYYGGAADFDPGVEEFMLTPVGYIDMFISKLDTDGNFVYANTYGGLPDGFNTGNALVADSSGNVYCTGSFEDTTDFDPDNGVLNLVSAGSGDIFVLKLDGAPLEIVESNLLSISLYPNPSMGSFNIDLGKEYTDVTVQIVNMLGQIISSKKYASVKIIEKQITSAAGIYFVKVSTTNEGSNTLRVIKQ